MGFEVRETQPTPNPNAMKYVLDRPVFEGSASFVAGTASGHPLAEKLFEIAGVERVLLLGSFITINKSSSAKWADINRKTKKMMAQYAPPEIKPATE